MTVIEETIREKLYVASSWRNMYHPAAVSFGKSAGFEVYDFKADGASFAWKDLGPDSPQNFETWMRALANPLAQEGYDRDFKALDEADRVLLVLPCGRSAHLELGYAIGQGKPSAIWSPEYDEPDLMVKMADLVTDDAMVILDWLGVKD